MREKEEGMRNNPRLGIGIINRLADNLRQMGGGSNPYGVDAILTPGPSSHFVRINTPLVRRSCRSIA